MTSIGATRAWNMRWVLCFLGFVPFGGAGCAAEAESDACELTCSSTGSNLSVSSSCGGEPESVHVCSFDQFGRATKLTFDGMEVPVTCADIQYNALGELTSATCWAGDGSSSCTVPESRDRAAFGETFENGCGTQVLPPTASDCPPDIVGDGICDDASGTGLCAEDEEDCAGTEPAVEWCAEACMTIGQAACPEDNLSSCESGCYSNLIDPRSECRSLWREAYACGTEDTEKTCNEEGRSVMGQRCVDAFMNYAEQCAQSL